MDWLEHLMARERSTRSSALIRIGIALLLWTRFGPEMAPWYSTLEPDRLLLGTSFYLSTTMLLIGWHARVASAWTAATMLVAFYGYGVFGEMEPWRHHHTYLLTAATALLALLPSGASFSVDRLLAVRRARASGQPIPEERGPTWALTLIALQLAAVYLWSVVDKASWHFLSGDRLDIIFVDLYFGFRPEHPLWSASLAVMAWITVVLEIVLPIGLFVRRLQPWLVPTGLLLHGLFYVLLPVGTFSATMALLYLAYLDPDDVHRIIDDLLGQPVASGDPAAQGSQG